jgi:DNA repair protein RadC
VSLQLEITSLKILRMEKASEIQLVYKRNETEKLTINNSRDTYEIAMAHWDENNIELFEEFRVILLTNSSAVLGIVKLSQGGMSGTIVDFKLIFGAALKCAATRIILVHNHPSGKLRPSEQDIAMTKKCQTAGQYIQIQILDHLIISKDGFYSFLDEGML